MAREKSFPEPPGDIPAWFMTYSDVITLLMTFFILLLTFATTEPERFEKSISSTFSKGAATGTAGKKIDDIEKDSWVRRLRPPAARIAMRGAEMPPITKAPAKATFGEGLRSLDEDESKQNEMTAHSFDVPAVQVFDSAGALTSKGKLICQMLAKQLQALPFQAAIQFTDINHTENISGLMQYLFDTEKTRPGQLAMNFVKRDDLDEKHIRFTIKRFTVHTK